MGIERMESIARARSYIRKGVSATRWISEMRGKGLGYSKTTMLADYRTVLNIEKKTELLKYVRKDRYPTQAIYATTTWDLKKEFMYVVRVKTQLRPDEPVITHDINIQTDVPLTPAEVEARVIEERAKEERYFGEILLEVMPWTAIRKVTE